MIILTFVSGCWVVIESHIVFSAVLRGRIYIPLLNSSYGYSVVPCLPPRSYISTAVSLFEIEKS